MTIRKCLPIPLLAILAATLFACAFLSPAEGDLIVKITSRRLAAHGAALSPDIFTMLGKTAQDACDKPGETLTPAQALSLIAEAVIDTIGDPLLAADLKDLLALLGIRFDPAFKLIGLTEEQERLIKIAVCSFAEGVQLNL